MERRLNESLNCLGRERCQDFTDEIMLIVEEIGPGLELRDADPATLTLRQLAENVRAEECLDRMSRNALPLCGQCPREKFHNFLGKWVLQPNKKDL